MLKILIVDDEKVRVSRINYLFANINEDKIILSAQNINEVKIIFHNNDYFDFIFLDHDLGDTTNSGNNGIEVTKLIVANNIKYKCCIIHTMNEPASHNMLDILDGNAELIPFIFLERRHVNTLS